MRNHIKELALRFVPHRLMLVLKQLEVVLRCYYLHCYYEKDAYQLLEIVGTQSEGIAIDVGANMGQFSFPISHLPNCTKVISIEPQPIVSNLFRMMTSVLCVDKIEHVEVLLSDTNGFAYIHTPKRSGHLLNQETYMIHERKNDNEEKIKVIKLDDLIAEYRINPEQIILIKIDVEGAEFGVLKGSEQVISMSRPIIMVELLDNFLSRFGVSFREPFAWLEQFGYKAYWFDGKHMVLLSEDDSPRSPSGNYFFIPNGSVHKEKLKKS